MGNDQLEASKTSRRGAGRWSWGKTAVLGGMLTAFAVAVVVFRQHLTLEQLAAQEAVMRRWLSERPWTVFAGAFALYFLCTSLSIPVATVLSLTFGWYFRFWRALLLVSIASTAGATIAFLLSRYLFRQFVEARFAKHVRKFDEAIERDGAFFLFALRLTPVAPFALVNLVMGLTRVRTRTFWWVSQLGMLPNTIVYVYAGSSAPDLRTLANQGLSGLPVGRLLAAFFLIGCFPMAARWLVRRLRPKVLDARQ